MTFPSQHLWSDYPLPSTRERPPPGKATPASPQSLPCGPWSRADSQCLHSPSPPLLNPTLIRLSLHRCTKMALVRMLRKVPSALRLVSSSPLTSLTAHLPVLRLSSGSQLLALSRVAVVPSRFPLPCPVSPSRRVSGLTPEPFNVLSSIPIHFRSLLNCRLHIHCSRSPLRCTVKLSK